MIIRKQILQKRKHLDLDFQNEASSKVLENLLNLKEFQNAKNIALYLAIKGELITLPILKKSWSLKKKCYLPKINIENKMLTFILYQEHGELTKNNYGILEPRNINNEDKLIATTSLDLVITPLVAFDIAGNRLGMGGGFYDKNFAFKKNIKNQKPYLVGVAYEFQKVQTFAVNYWDVPLDFVITENKIYSFSEEKKHE